MHIETHSLTKSYRQVVALDDCTLGIEKGEVFGLLGPNGAGKTTLLRILLGFISPTSGRATIGGLDCARDKVRVHCGLSYLPGEARLFRRMTGHQALKFFSKIRAGFSIGRAWELADYFDLDLTRPVGMMSTGMRQKLALAIALTPDVPLVILDEPTSNLDPTVRAKVAHVVEEAKTAGRTVVFSSHVMSEVEAVCDRVAILRRGSLVHVQKMTDLRRQHLIRAELNGTLPPLPEQLSGAAEILPRDDHSVEIRTNGDLSPLLGWLATLPLGEVRIEPVGLSSVYDRFHDAKQA